MVVAPSSATCSHTLDIPWPFGIAWTKCSRAVASRRVRRVATITPVTWSGPNVSRRTSCSVPSSTTMVTSFSLA